MAAVSNFGVSIAHFKNGDMDINVSYPLLVAVTTIAVATIISIGLCCKGFWNSRAAPPNIYINTKPPEPTTTLGHVQKFVTENYYLFSIPSSIIFIATGIKVLFW